VNIIPTLPVASESLADLLVQLGEIPIERVRIPPLPGQATAADVLAALNQPQRRICELIDGTLVEKAMGYRESQLAALLIELLNGFVRSRNLGIVSGADGMMRLFPGRVRIPDVGFTSWDRFPNRRRQPEPIPDLAPDLAVEVLSDSNTRAEMRRKREDYFQAGCRLVWEIDPEQRTVTIYTRVDPHDAILTGNDTLTGDPVLPGFVLPLAAFFQELDRHG
jgi:Uma2 family endonuclease